jgi:hypothetical protein
MKRYSLKRQERIRRCREMLEFFRKEAEFTQRKVDLYERRLFILQSGPIRKRVSWAGENIRKLATWVLGLFGIEALPPDPRFDVEMSDPDEHGNQDID